MHVRRWSARAEFRRRRSGKPVSIPTVAAKNTANPTTSSAAKPSSADDLVCCFLASHIGDHARASAFERLLASVDSQMPQCASLWLSWHAPFGANHEAVRRELERHKGQHWLRLVLEQPRPCSQFEHLAALVAAASSGGQKPRWVYFSDDDDLWSPARAHIFRTECSKADAQGSASVLVSRRKARPCEAATQGFAAPVDEPADAMGVRALIAAGLAQLTDTERVERDRGNADPTSGETPSGYHRAELFDFAVRFELLSTFCRVAPPNLLSHKLCDLGFVRWLRARAERIDEPLRPFLPQSPTEVRRATHAPPVSVPRVSRA